MAMDKVAFLNYLFGADNPRGELLRDLVHTDTGRNVANAAARILPDWVMPDGTIINPPKEPTPAADLPAVVDAVTPPTPPVDLPAVVDAVTPPTPPVDLPAVVDAVTPKPKTKRAPKLKVPKLKVPKTKAVKQAADAFEQPVDTVVDGVKTALRTKRSDVTPPRKNNVMPLYTVPSGIPGTDNGRNAQDPAALAEPPRQTKNWDHLNMLFG